MSRQQRTKSIPELAKATFLVLAATLIVCPIACKDAGTEVSPSYTNALCYVKSHNRHWEIFTNNLSGTNPQDISNYAGDDEYPQWSPNGRYIVYSRSVPVNGPLIIIYDTQTNTSTNLTSDGGGASQQPQWTPDNRVCFGYPFAWAPYRGTYIMNPDGSNRKRILDVAATVYFYQDSYTFLYKNGTEIYKTNIDGTSNEFILNTEPSTGHWLTIRDFNGASGNLLVNTDSALAEFDVHSRSLNMLVAADSAYMLFLQRYSEDFSKIVFIEHSDRDEYLSVLENGIKRRLVRIPANVPLIVFSFVPMQFSPDGRYVAYTKQVWNSGAWVSWRDYLHVVDVATSEVHYIDEGFGPSWNSKAGE